MSRFWLIALVTLALASTPLVAPATPLLYVDNNNPSSTISAVAANGTISTFVTGQPYPEGLAIDASGNVYVANGGVPGTTISKITPGAGVSTFAAGLNAPEDLAFDSSGNLCVTVMGAYPAPEAIDKIAPDGTVSPFVTAAQGVSFGYLACDNSGNLYTVNAAQNNAILKITPGGTVSTLTAGVGPVGGLACDPSGNLYVTSSSIYQITASGAVSTFVTSPTGLYSSSLASDGFGDLYTFAPGGAHASIVEITPTGTISTIATGLSSPQYIVVAPTPEPVSILLLASAGGLCLLRRSRPIATTAAGPTPAGAD
jgi:sugar lactone lactonase YvrE